MRKFIVYPGNNPGVVKRAILERGGWEEAKDDKFETIENIHFIWKPTNLEIRTYAILSELDMNSGFIQIINHFENNRGICTKTGLIRSLKQYYSTNEQAFYSRYHVFDSTPTTFLITAGNETTEFNGFYERFNELAQKKYQKEHLPAKHCSDNLWLIKPANMNQGKGIEIFKTWKEIQNFLNTQVVNTFWVAQKYVEKPLLYYGRKFDIRVWVLVTSKMEIFFYKRPYMRTSSDEYSMSNFNNYVHLTNNCLQKYGDKFGKYEDGNTLPMERLQQYLDETYPDLDINIENHLFKRMKDLIIDSILSVKKQLNPKRRKHCFELFGYDFLIDEDIRTWLLEINTNPYLGVPNNFIKELLPKMIKDMLSIILDPIYPPETTTINNENNDFELIYCEKESKYSSKPKNDRSPFYENIYPVPSLAQPIKVQKNAMMERQHYKDRDDGNHLLPEIITEKKSSLLFQSQDDRGTDKLSRPKFFEISARTPEPERIKFMNQTPEFDAVKESRLHQIQPITGNHANNVSNVPVSRIEVTIKQIESMLELATVIDTSQFVPLTTRVLSNLVNWELLSDKEINMACTTIQMLAESKVCSVLTEISHVEKIVKLLESQNVPLEIQIAIIRGILQICRRFSEKKKLLCDSLVHALIKIAMASCDENLIKDYDRNIISMSIQCLGALCGVPNKNYIPGETREINKARNFLIRQGGILALMIVYRDSVDEELKLLPESCCLKNLDVEDWRLQKDVLQEQVDRKDMIKEYEILDGKKAPYFLFPESMSSPKLEYKKPENSAYYISEIKTNIPEKGYTVEHISNEIEEKINLMKEEKRRREQEEQERRNNEMMEQKRDQEEREKVKSERRKQAEEIFMKRYEEKKKQADENAKKIEEEIKMRLLQEEEKRKMKLQELMRKKEEQDKKNRLLEKQKRKQEEDLKKMMEEEEIKRKEIQKQLEESFWARVRARDKSKEKDVINEDFLEKERKKNQSKHFFKSSTRNSKDEDIEDRIEESPMFSRTGGARLHNSYSEKSLNSSANLGTRSRKSKRQNINPGLIARNASVDEIKPNGDNIITLPHLFVPKINNGLTIRKSRIDDLTILKEADNEEDKGYLEENSELKNFLSKPKSSRDKFPNLAGEDILKGDEAKKKNKKGIKLIDVFNFDKEKILQKEIPYTNPHQAVNMRTNILSFIHKSPYRLPVGTSKSRLKSTPKV